MKFFLTLFAFFCFSSFLHAQLQSIDVEPFELTDPNSLIPEGTVVYRVYANFLSPTDQLSAVYGGGCKPLDVSTTTTFFNDENGGITPANIDAAMYATFPNLEADSWVTIGIDDATDEGAIGVQTIASSGQPFNDALGVNPGMNLIVPDGAWYTTETVSAFGTGPENRVLIAQFTTDGALSFHLNLSVFVDGNQQFGRIDYVWNTECEDSGFESDGTAFGLTFEGTYCGDVTACNYNAFALEETYDLAVCNYTSCAGCTNSSFCNYSPYFTQDDGACSDTCPGCTDTEALNFDASANTDDGTCLYPGCTDVLASNYQTNAGEDDGSCFYEGCTDQEAYNYFILADDDDGSCLYTCNSSEVAFSMTSTLGVGWLDGYYIVTDQNGDFVASGSLETADISDGSTYGFNTVCLAPGEYTVEVFGILPDGIMLLEIGCAEEGNVVIEGLDPPTTITVESGVNCLVGCTDELASNYDPEANLHFGCVYLGCTDPLALNFDPAANEDDGSCEIAVTGWVFFDANANGVFDEGVDNGLPNYPLQLNPSTATYFTDDSGYVSIANLPAGFYTLSVQPNAQFPISSTSDSFSFTLEGMGIQPFYFGIMQDEAVASLEISSFDFNEGLPCDGALEQVYFSVKNSGTTTLSGETTFTFDQLYPGYTVAIPEPISVDDNNLTFEFENLAPGEYALFHIGLISPSAENVGNEVTKSYTATAFEGELEMAVANETVTSTITCEDSANQKATIPIGYEIPHFVLNTTRLHYKVDVQNETSTVVNTVVLRDTLDVSLDLNSFLVEATSHPCEVVLDWESREVVFTLANANLPPVDENAMASVGVVYYSIQPLASASANTTIYNAASIVFDEVLITATNTVFHTLYTCGEEAVFTANNEVCLGETISASATSPYIEYYTWTLDGAFLSDEASVVLPTTESGTFELALTAGNVLCETTSEIELTIFTIPNPQITQEGSVLTTNSGQAWQWFLNGEAIEGATEISLIIEVEGIYSVEVTNTNGCVGLSSDFFATPMHILNEATSAMAFFPNPFFAEATLTLSHAGPWQLRLCDSTGRVIQERIVNGTKWTLEGSTLPPGHYFLQLQHAQETKTVAVFKMN